MKTKMKRGFGVISAIIILILIASLMSVVVKISFMSVHHTQSTYLQQRAQLFMQSAVENAIMAIEGYKRNSDCLRDISFIDENGMFEANITVLRYYCYDLNDCPCGSLVKQIETPKSHGYVLMKVVVESNLSNPRIEKKIRLEKITLQRP